MQLSKSVNLIKEDIEYLRGTDKMPGIDYDTIRVLANYMERERHPLED